MLQFLVEFSEVKNILFFFSGGYEVDTKSVVPETTSKPIMDQQFLHFLRLGNFVKVVYNMVKINHEVGI